MSVTPKLQSLTLSLSHKRINWAQQLTRTQGFVSWHLNIWWDNSSRTFLCHAVGWGGALMFAGYYVWSSDVRSLGLLKTENVGTLGRKQGGQKDLQNKSLRRASAQNLQGRTRENEANVYRAAWLKWRLREELQSDVLVDHLTSKHKVSCKAQWECEVRRVIYMKIIPSLKPPNRQNPFSYHCAASTFNISIPQ